MSGVGEVVGLAASGAGLVSLAGQLLQGILYLHDFFEGMKDVPENISELKVELDALKTILCRLQKHSSHNAQPKSEPASSSAPQAACLASPSLSATVAEQNLGVQIDPVVQSTSQGYSSIIAPNEKTVALQFCLRWVTKLNDLIITYDRGASQSGGKRLWTQLSASLKEKKFEKYIRALERGKSMLSQAHVLELGETLLQNSNNTHEGLEQVATELASLGIQHTQHAVITTEIHRKVLAVEEHTLDIKGALRDLVGEGQMTAIQPALEKVIRKEIQKELNKMRPITTGLWDAGPPPNQLERKTTESLLRGSIDGGEFRAFADLKSRSRESPFEGLDETPTTKAKKCTKIMTNLDLWFGRVFICNEQEPESRDCSHHPMVTRILFIPRPWLFKRGFLLSVMHITKQRIRPTVTYHLRPLTIIPNSNPVFSAISSTGSFANVSRIFDEDLACPFDIDQNGNNLLFHALLYILVKILDSHALYESLYEQKTDEMTIMLIDKIKRKAVPSPDIADSIKIAKFLIGLGVETGHNGNDSRSEPSMNP
jgi:hypothetical protein